MHSSFLRCCSQLSAIPSKMHPLLCGFRLWFLQLFWFVNVLTRRGREEGVFSGRGFEEIQKSLKVVSEGSGASLKKVQGGGKKRRRGTRKKRRKMLRWKVELIEKRPCSLLCKVCSDGEAGRSERSQAENCLDGGPGATEDGVPLSVVQLHKCILRWETETTD